jgi:hypothetical protein
MFLSFSSAEIRVGDKVIESVGRPHCHHEHCDGFPFAYGIQAGPAFQESYEIFSFSLPDFVAKGGNPASSDLDGNILPEQVHDDRADRFFLRKRQNVLHPVGDCQQAENSEDQQK